MDNSTLIGVVLNADPVLQYEEDDEKFYSILMSFNGVKLHVLYSEYTPVEIEKDMLLEVCGLLESDCSKGVPKFYFYSNSIKPAAPDAEQSSTIKVFGHVNRVGTVKTVRNGHDQLPITLIARWRFGGRSLIYTVLRDKMARMYQHLSNGTPVEVTGRLAAYRDVVEVVVQHIIIKK